MKPRARVFSARLHGWYAHCLTCELVDWRPNFPDALAIANAHARTHRRTDIGSFLALRDDHPHDRRWGDALSHDMPEPPC